METFRPIPLMQPRTYPTFQLQATIRPSTLDQDTTFLVAVLETFKWLKERFKENVGIPDEINIAEPDEYGSVSLEQLSSFVLNNGYILEVVWLKDERTWTLKLTEPDLGLVREFPREPIPGRTFETSISFVAIGAGDIRVGVRIDVTDISQSAPECEVIRPTIVKQLARNSVLGLWQGLPLKDKAHCIDTGAQLDHLVKWLKDSKRTMVAVIQFRRNEEKTNPLPKFTGAVPLLNGLGAKLHTEADKPFACNPVGLGLDFDELARFRIGWAHYCIVSPDQTEKFNKLSYGVMSDGDVLMLFPATMSCGESQKHFSQPEALLHKDEIDALVRDYCLAKDYDWGQILFVDSAREKRQAAISESATTLQEVRDVYTNLLNEERSKAQTELKNLQNQINGLTEKNITLQAEIGSRKGTGKAADSQVLEQLATQDRTITLLNREIEHLKMYIEHPKSLENIAEWAAEHILDELTLLPRAKRELEKAAGDRKHDVHEVCDALEYLAKEYRSEMLKEISEDEANSRCSALYGRRFSVTAQAEPTINLFPKDYRVQYTPGPGEGIRDWDLDRHLRRGSGDDLIRIYFFWDSRNQKVIVGSLPEHLKTMRDPK